MISFGRFQWRGRPPFRWMANWVEVTPRDIPNEWSGCYAVYQHNKLVYIGSSQHLRSRISTYFRKPKQYPNHVPENAHPPYSTPWGFRHHGDAIRVKCKLSQRWQEHERKLIRKLNPLYNKIGAGR